MKLKLKLPLAFGLTLALLLAAALFGIHTMHRSLATFDTVVRQHMANERAVKDLENAFKTQVQEWKNTLLRGRDPQQLEKYWAAFQKEEQRVAEAARALHAALPEGESRTLVDRFAQAHAAMGQGYRRGFEAFKAADFASSAGDNGVKGMDREPARLLEEASRRIAEESAAIAAQASQEGRQALTLSLAVMFGVSLLGVVIGVAVSRLIVRPLDQAVKVARAVADGDLTRTVRAEGRDETAQLLGALADMQTQLTCIVQGVRRNAESVAETCGDLAQGSRDLSARTDLQASALQQTAASMEQLNATVRLNADNARQADQLARGASGVACKGGEVVGEVVQTMKGINDSSKQIADIIGVIDGIAFQTNILALNAAVEAARAGEQGRGFAVVAGEVRALAQRSATAAREIKTLIGASVERVERGAALVDQAGLTMNEVVDAIRRVTDIMGEISVASGEQTSGVAQIGAAVDQMDEATRHNASLVERSADAAEVLRSRAEQLVESVAVFRLPAAA